MASEGSGSEDDWNDDIFEIVARIEESYVPKQSTQPPQAADQTTTPPPSPRQPQPQPQRLPEVSYSPPRELSQRTHETHSIPDSSNALAARRMHFDKEQEVDILKKELNRVTKQLGNLENECSELRKEKDKKEEQLKVLQSRLETKDAEIHLTKNKETDGLCSSSSAPGISTMRRNANPSNEQLSSTTKSLQTTSRCSKKLFALWNSDDQKQGRALVATLYKTCEEDFRVLLNYLNSPENDSNMASSDKKYPTQPIETAKVLYLYSVFTKISNDNSRLEDLLEALVDLCNLKNVFIVHWSLRVLNKIFSNPISMEKEFGKRENVIIEDAFSESTNADTNGCGNSANESLSFENVADMLKQGQVPPAQKLSNVKTPSFSGFFNRSFATSVSSAYQVTVFERMCLIANKNNEEQIRCEALSIMNLILVRHNAYLERDKFAGELVFQSLSQLLRKEAGFSAQDQAVRTLHLLFNCPKVVAMVYSCVKEDGELACANDIDKNSVPISQSLNEILIGLADCVACYGSGTAEEMKLRTNAIVFLAFLGSSGKSGFEILLNYSLPKGNKFLAIILQSLISDLDHQASKSAEKSQIAQEQILLIREALILFNRLVSHSQYSVPVLQALTATRDMASMTVDFANRLTQKSTLLWRDRNSLKQIRESEIVEMANIFKKRIFTFLGDNIS